MKNGEFPVRLRRPIRFGLLALAQISDAALPAEDNFHGAREYASDLVECYICDRFEKVFGKKLGDVVDVLRLLPKQDRVEWLTKVLRRPLDENFDKAFAESIGVHEMARLTLKESHICAALPERPVAA